MKRRRSDSNLTIKIMSREGCGVGESCQHSESAFNFDSGQSVLVTQSCLTLCDPKDCSPPGSSVHGIFQARILEWVAMPSLLQGIFPIQVSNPCLLSLLHWQVGPLPLAPPEWPPSKYLQTIYAGEGVEKKEPS